MGHGLNLWDAWKVMEMWDCPSQRGTSGWSGHPKCPPVRCERTWRRGRAIHGERPCVMMTGWAERTRGARKPTWVSLHSGEPGRSETPPTVILPILFSLFMVCILSQLEIRQTNFLLPVLFPHPGQRHTLSPPRLAAWVHGGRIRTFPKKQQPSPRLFLFWKVAPMALHVRLQWGALKWLETEYNNILQTDASSHSLDVLDHSF